MKQTAKANIQKCKPNCIEITKGIEHKDNGWKSSGRFSEEGKFLTDLKGTNSDYILELANLWPTG